MTVRNYYPVVAAMVVAVLFGFSFLFTKVVLDYLQPFQLIGLRFALAAASLSILALFGLIKLNIKLGQLTDLLKVAIWQPVLYFTCETYGVKFTTASESGVIISLIPVMVAVLSFFILKERVSLKQGFFIASAVFGVVLMVLGGTAGSGGSPGQHLLGVAILFGAVLSGGFYSIFSRQASEKYSTTDITFVMMWLGAVVFNIIGLVQSYLNGQLGNYAAALVQPQVINGLLYLGILSSVVAFFLLNYSLSRLPAPRVSVFLNLIPVISVIAGVAFNNEVLGVWHLVGGSFILLGVWGTNYFGQEDTSENHSEELKVSV
ncbi:MAG: EamA/RhaT family transporter [Firmicutes bacterium]|nr:EamA/RhaT family transporter [Bacillota bacterium]